jgi:Xaa-Pro aminopeptidase
MKTDLITLMERKKIDALWITGSASHNPAMSYFTGRVHVGSADLIWIRGKEPVLFCNAMEREEAASTGLETVVIAKYDFGSLIEKAAGDLPKARALMMEMIYKELGFTSGRVSMYGKVDASGLIGVLDYLKELLPGLEIIGEGANSLLLEARATKDDQEIQRIRHMGAITTGVVGQVAEFLQNCQVRDDEVLINKNGDPVTIGQVKTKIDFWLAEKGVENPHGCIFSIGRDAGIPHSAGNPDDEIQLGKTIIFDIFPQEAGGGYHFDFTRTWCLGYAPKEEQQLYNDVRRVYEDIMAELEMDRLCPAFQDRTCDLFEALDHRTIRQDPQLESGYVHSLGHGLGLSVHERPWFGKIAGPEDILKAGSVVTIEPGLYYPDKGMGCRLEDSVWVRPDGGMEILADYPYDLVLPMKHWNG